MTGGVPNGDAAADGAERHERVVLADGAPGAYSIRPCVSPAPGRAVLLLHGLASNRTRWSEFAEFTTLARHFDVVRADLRGHGESVVRGRLTLERWCDDLAALLAVLGHPRAILVGHSLGAQVALAFAARHATRAAALVLIDPVFRAALRGKWRWIARASPLFRALAALVQAANACGLRRRHVQPYDLRALDALARRSLMSPEAEAAFIRQYSSTRADLRHFRTAHYLQDLVEMFRPTPPLASIAVPVLVLLSRAGTFADPQAMAAQVAQLPRGEVQWIDCHHWPLTEQPQQVREAIETWCEAQLSGPLAATA
jgi:pimeloyl-ACP methyl ester carboxylesterase